MLEALYCLNNLVDESDPDTNIANSVHAFQTAERIRQIHPDKEWFHLVGLIHDVGKVMACFGESQVQLIVFIMRGTLRYHKQNAIVTLPNDK